ncbi:winged helix-turn-helix domain-containing protein [Vibrio coralliilyticus]|uniref:winged helix-turn-helix domain-containing protein n=1 Tax=Vibrio coralliilyticus TaxID=190893 RepID=UPI00155F61B1|nr:transcriptional regulator [Vibrio coralliilyticus]NRF32553.1 winged helix-turn-helix domain-containing protein [Vibrio coralliilyticus]NRF54583.1 winged helix-turn-helix domain-containing protein [Vibrio coralliilyticus]NRG05238.1 winged helix-turn-helix domain-containing protein [Vibrio coralliilyticus]
MSNIGTKFNLANRFTFDPNTNSLVDKSNDNEVIRLGSNESRILLLLSEKPNDIVSRNELHDFVWREQGFEVDDSSLTQAISTLRKQLQDSTKSPQYVKTVPKRGYQLICNVERATPFMSGDTSVAEEEALEVEDVSVELPTDSHVDEVSPLKSTVTETKSAPSVAKQVKPQSRWAMRIMLVLALLIPLCVVLFTNPAESKFRQVAVYDNTPVKTPINHPDLSEWYPSIEQCVKRYNAAHATVAPVEVIATGGQNNQLVLNYIHSLDNSGENITVRIFAEQQDLSKVCQ